MRFKGNCITKKPGMGDNSQKLQPWSSPHDSQTYQYLLPSKRYCSYYFGGVPPPPLVSLVSFMNFLRFVSCLLPKPRKFAYFLSVNEPSPEQGWNASVQKKFLCIHGQSSHHRSSSSVSLMELPFPITYLFLFLFSFWWMFHLTHMLFISGAIQKYPKHTNLLLAWPLR